MTLEALALTPVVSESSTSTCPACGSRETSEFLEGITAVHRPTASYRRCNECACYFNSTSFDVQVEADHFRGFEWGKAQEAIDFGSRRQKLYSTIIDIVETFQPAPARLLDVGCSFGMFLQAAAKRGFDVEGIDIIEEAIEQVTASGLKGRVADSIGDLEPDHSGAVDVITCVDSNYYWSDQRTELNAAFNVLRPGGIMVFRTANKAWLFELGATLLKRQWRFGEWIVRRAIGDHRFSMPLTSFFKLARSCGFEVARVNYADAVSSADSGWHVKAAHFISRLRLSSAEKRLTPGAIVVLRKPLKATAGDVAILMNESRYGLRVLEAAMARQLPVARIIVAKGPSAFVRTRRLIKRYGIAAASLRILENVIGRMKGSREGAVLDSIHALSALNGIPVDEVSSLNGRGSLAAIRRSGTAMALAAGTPQLSSEVLDSFRMGVFAAHPGVLPKFRGNYCTRWSLLNDEPLGITVYKLDPKLDTGPIMMVRHVDLDRPRWLPNAETLMSDRAADFLVEAVSDYRQSGKDLSPQEEAEGATYHLMPFLTTLRLYLKLWARKE